MMNFLRNKEIKKSLLINILITSAGTILASLLKTEFGIFTLCLSLIFISTHLITSYRRYKKIYDLSADIDRILHNEDTNISLDKYAEGELGVLQSEIHKMTLHLKEQRQLLQNDKIYLADSIADISHQIRTPLTSINLLVHLLSENDISEEKRLNLNRELLDLLSRIDWLITTLLKISKLDAGTVEFTNERIGLSTLINKSVSPLLIPVELRNQTLEIKADGEFFGDTLWTQEAIVNIVKNCMEHTSENGKIRISANENALYSEIIISDNGIGISKEDLPHIFERFYKGKNSDDKSFGVGLALSRMIITKQNGTIKAENNSDGGASFIIRFYKGTI
ncbi:MAG: HAMP domain-containing histidine kinase [Clostridia bacterium]|nr:HAMP domain-containing histidine kinase [Clostridia bacterium]